MAGEDVAVQGGGAVDGAPSQEAQASDYFSMYEADFEEGGEVLGSTAETPEGGEQQKEPKADKAQSTPKEGEQQTQDEKEGEKGQKPLEPKGYFEQFFRDSEDGAKVLDPKAAVERLTAAEGYKHPGRQFVQPDPNAQQQPIEQVDEFEKAYDEHNGFKQALEDNMMLGLREFVKAFQETKNGDAAYARAEAAVNKLLRKEIARRDLDFDKQWRYGRQAQDEEQRNLRNLESMARINEERAAQQYFGGDKGKFGEAVAQFAGDFLNFWFDAMNPDMAQGQVTQEQHKDAFQRWWVKLASNEGALAMLNQYIRGQAALQALPHLVADARSAAQQQAAQLAEGHRRNPAGMHATPRAGDKNGTGHELVDRFMNGPTVEV